LASAARLLPPGQASVGQCGEGRASFIAGRLPQLETDSPGRPERV